VIIIIAGGGTHTTTSHYVIMSMMEDSTLFPFFSSAELPLSIDGFGGGGGGGLVPGSPDKYLQLRKSSTLINSQGYIDEPLFSIFLNGELFLSGMDESLMQAGVVPDGQKMDMSIPRQYVSIVPDGACDSMVPSSPATTTTPNSNSKTNGRRAESNARKRKYVQPPSKAEDVATPCNEGPSQPLSPEEEKNFKRQRRLVKNREAAQLFRQRQKAYIHDLEKKVTDLNESNNDFRARIELLTSENKLIKEQLLYLRNFVAQAVSFFPKNNGSSNGMPIPAGLANLALGSPGLSGSMSGMLHSVASFLAPLAPTPMASMAASSSTTAEANPLSPSLVVSHPCEPLTTPLMDSEDLSPPMTTDQAYSRVTTQTSSSVCGSSVTDPNPQLCEVPCSPATQSSTSTCSPSSTSPSLSPGGGAN